MRARVTQAVPLHDRPLATPGLMSYRYPSGLGWVMIGARDEADALNEAARSLTNSTPVPGLLQAWNGTRYTPTHAAGASRHPQPGA